jgi:hypothetical protein
MQASIDTPGVRAKGNYDLKIQWISGYTAKSSDEKALPKKCSLAGQSLAM